MGGGGEETSMDKVMRDPGAVALIVGKLWSTQDRYAAALVCRLWHDAVVWQATKLTLRSRDSLPHVVKTFKHIVALNLSCCDEKLTNSDLEYCAMSFGHLRSLSVGHTDHDQESITDEGILAFAERCGYLEEVKLANLARVGDAAIQGLSKGCQSLRCLNLQHCRIMGDDALDAICEFGNLEELHLKGEFKFTPGGLARIGLHCSGLLTVSFALGDTKINTALKALAEGCPKLRDLTLRFRLANLRVLANCTNLRSFYVESDLAWDRGVNMDEAVVAIAKANKSLKEFSFLTKGGLLSDGAVIGVILACPLLETLRLEAANLTDAALMCIVTCKSLQNLVLDNLRSTGQGLTEIGQCGLGLTTLSLRNARRVRDMEMQTLMHGNGRLISLDLQYCEGPSAIGFSAIAACRNLQFLDLSATEVDDMSLLAIGREIPNLKRLILEKCKNITSMKVLRNFTSLETLNLDHCPFVTDIELEELTKHSSRLIHLSLAFQPRVTDRGLAHLGNCQMLRSLRVSYCPSVLGDGVVAVARACRGFNHVVFSYKFRNSSTYEALKEQSCRISLEMDEMALVPFGYHCSSV